LIKDGKDYWDNLTVETVCQSRSAENRLTIKRNWKKECAQGNISVFL